MSQITVEPGSFSTAADYSQWVDAYNASSPGDRLTMLQALNPENSDNLERLYQLTGGNLTNAQLGSYGNTMGGKFSDWIDNLFTGNRDYARSIYVQGLDQRFNAAEAQKQRDYEERLANSAYQRAAADAEAAGFNPGLIMGQGGAATPHGAVAYSQHNANVKSGYGGLRLVGSIVGTAFSAISAMARSSIGAAVQAGAKAAASAAKTTISHPDWYNKYLSDLDKASKADKIAMKKQSAADRAELAELEHIFD